jgi:hypothetical protein
MLSMWGREINSAAEAGAVARIGVIFKAFIVRKRWMRWRGGEGEKGRRGEEYQQKRRGGGGRASSRATQLHSFSGTRTSERTRRPETFVIKVWKHFSKGMTNVSLSQRKFLAADHWRRILSSV